LLLRLLWWLTLSWCRSRNRRSSTDSSTLTVSSWFFNGGCWTLRLSASTSWYDSLWLDRRQHFYILNAISLHPLVDGTWYNNISSGRQDSTVKRIESKWTFHYMLVYHVPI
jgi:hypothetical protein